MQPRVYALNLRLIKGFKKALFDTPQPDISDTYAIAKSLRFGRPPVPFMPNQLYHPSQRLPPFRCYLMLQITSGKKRKVIELRNRESVKYGEAAGMYLFYHKTGLYQAALVKQ